MSDPSPYDSRQDLSRERSPMLDSVRSRASAAWQRATRAAGRTSSAALTTGQARDDAVPAPAVASRAARALERPTPPEWWPEAFSQVRTPEQAEAVIARLRSHYLDQSARQAPADRALFDAFARGAVTGHRNALTGRVADVTGQSGPPRGAPIEWAPGRVAAARDAAVGRADPIAVAARLTDAVTTRNHTVRDRDDAPVPAAAAGPDGMVRVSTVSWPDREQALRVLRDAGYAAYPDVEQVNEHGWGVGIVVAGWDTDQLAARVADLDDAVESYRWRYGDAAEAALWFYRENLAAGVSPDEARTSAVERAAAGLRHADDQLMVRELGTVEPGSTAHALLTEISGREQHRDRLGAAVAEVARQVTDRYDHHRAVGLPDVQAEQAVRDDVFGTRAPATADDQGGHAVTCGCCRGDFAAEAVSPVKGWCQGCEDNVAEAYGYEPELVGERHSFTPTALLDDPIADPATQAADRPRIPGPTFRAHPEDARRAHGWAATFGETRAAARPSPGRVATTPASPALRALLAGHAPTPKDPTTGGDTRAVPAPPVGRREQQHRIQRRSH